MKYDSKPASDTLIGPENRSGRVEIVETGLKTGESSRRAAGSCRSVTRGSPSLLCRGTTCAAMWHVVAAEWATSCSSVGSKRESQSGLGRGPVRWLRKSTEPRLIIGPWLTRLGRKCLGCKPAWLDRESGLGLVQLNRSYWASLRFGPL